MPPARPRNIDDSRSDASSTVTNQKEKSLLGATSGSGTSKGKRTASNLHGPGGSSKAATNGSAAAAGLTSTAAADTERDPSLPRTEWTTMPTSILRTYRIAHRLPVPAAFNHGHAELTYTSSELALRAPSAVQARRKLRDQKHQRRKLQQAQTNGTGKSSKSKDKGKERSSVAQSIEAPDQNSEQASTLSSATTSSTYLGRREPATHLANSIRKHFNAQQLSEADTIARFIYVVQQHGKSVATEGSAGDGTGSWMGSHGRQVRKIDGPGGEVGFRLRFRP